MSERERLFINDDAPLSRSSFTKERIDFANSCGTHSLKRSTVLTVYWADVELRAREGVFGQQRYTVTNLFVCCPSLSSHLQVFRRRAFLVAEQQWWRKLSLTNEEIFDIPFVYIYDLSVSILLDTILKWNINASNLSPDARTHARRLPNCLIVRYRCRWWSKTVYSNNHQTGVKDDDIDRTHLRRQSTV